MLVTEFFGDNFEMLATILANLVTKILQPLTIASGVNIHKMSPISKFRHQHLSRMNSWKDKNISKRPTMIIFISDKKMSGIDKETSHPKRSLANIFEVQLWRKRKSFYLFLRFNFNGTSFSFDNVLLNDVLTDLENVTVRDARTAPG